MGLDYDKREDRRDWAFPDRYRVPRRSELTKARGSHPCRICPSGCINPQQRLYPPWAALHGAWSLPSQRGFEVQQKRLEKWAGEEGGKALDLGAPPSPADQWRPHRASVSIILLSAPDCDGGAALHELPSLSSAAPLG